MTATEKAIRDFCGHRADWWPSTTQVQAMYGVGMTREDVYETIEAKLKEKNT